MAMAFTNRSFSFVTTFVILVIASLTVSSHDIPKNAGDTSEAVEAHKRLDFGFPGFAELNRQLSRDFIDFDNAPNLTLAGVYDASFGLSDGYAVGSWSPVYTLPIVPIQVVLLTDGKLLMWDSVGDKPAETYTWHNSTRAAILDPLSLDVARVDNSGWKGTGYNIFCSGFAHLPDGTPFIAGGNRNSSLEGLNVTHYFKHSDNTWKRGPNMREGDRWYPSVTPLANGEMLITSGGPGTPEVLSKSLTLRSLSDAEWYMDLYPWLQAAPNGDAFYFGPGNEISYIDTQGTGSMTPVKSRDSLVRSYGSYAMYDIGKIVASGGGQSSKTTVAIDIRNPNIDPLVSHPANMAFGRRQHNLTVLPDGSVLATGGNSSGASLIDMDANVFEAELWNPVTQTWRTLSRASKVRQYHSTAILLPDGRVFTGGGGICGDCANVGYLQKNYEIFTPPYLFKSDGSGELAPRPTIDAAPTSVTYDQAFSVTSPDAANIKSAVMMRVSSVTHSVDFEQRRVPLSFSTSSGGLSVRAPANANIAPPGMYMLFLIDKNGVPSTSKMISVQYGTGLGTPMIVSTTGSNSNATLAWIPVPGATGYTISYGQTSGNYTSGVQVGNVTTLSLTGLDQELYYFAVAATNGAGSGNNSAEVLIQPNLRPTAAGVTVAGRVTASNGMGLSRVRVTIEGGGLKEPRTILTNPFGYFSFKDVEVGRSYIVSVSSKRYGFAQPSRLLFLTDSINNCDFTSTPGSFGVSPSGHRPKNEEP